MTMAYSWTRDRPARRSPRRRKPGGRSWVLTNAVQGSGGAPGGRSVVRTSGFRRRPRPVLPCGSPAAPGSSAPAAVPATSADSVAGIDSGPSFGAPERSPLVAERRNQPRRCFGMRAGAGASARATEPPAVASTPETEAPALPVGAPSAARVSEPGAPVVRPAPAAGAPVAGSVPEARAAVVAESAPADEPPAASAAAVSAPAGPRRPALGWGAPWAGTIPLGPPVGAGGTGGRMPGASRPVRSAAGPGQAGPGAAASVVEG
jgi:hypothetical protein